MRGRKFAGQDVGFVDEVEAYFDVHIAKGDPERYLQAHRMLDDALGGSGPLAERMQAYRAGEEIPPERLEEAIHAFSSALRDRVRAEYPLPDTETITYEVVTDKPWSGFNYYLGDYRSTVAVNADLKQQMSNLPRLVAHESYPGHHTEHCRKEAGLVEGKGHAEQTIFLVNTPQCLMAEGLADLGAARRDRAELGRLGRRDLRRPRAALRRRARARRCRKQLAALADVRQDAALMLHDEHRDVDDVGRLPQALAAGQRRTRPADAALLVLAAVARLHQHLRRGLPAAARLAGGPARRRQRSPNASGGCWTSR